MLQPIHLATIQAALRFWADEMCPHGAYAMRPYLRPAGVEILLAEEVHRLASLLAPSSVRYVRVAGRRPPIKLEGPVVSYRVAANGALEDQSWATLILPPPPSR